MNDADIIEEGRNFYKDLYTKESIPSDEINKYLNEVYNLNKLKESIRKRIFGPVHIRLDVTVRVTNQIPTIYPKISTQSSIENYAKMRLESRRLSPYLFTCDVTHSLSVESHLQAFVLHFIRN